MAEKQPVIAAEQQTQPRWRVRANWRRLERGMSRDEVRAILGEPTHVEGGWRTYWTYGGKDRLNGPHVGFQGETVSEWEEP